jgi:hypothetical protein
VSVRAAGWAFPGGLSQLAIPVHLSHNLFALRERIVGLESLVFVTRVLNEIREHVKTLLPHGRHRDLDDFYREDVDCVEELRAMAYRIISLSLLNVRLTLWFCVCFAGRLSVCLSFLCRLLVHAPDAFQWDAYAHKISEVPYDIKEPAMTGPPWVGTFPPLVLSTSPSLRLTCAFQVNSSRISRCLWTSSGCCLQAR